ncbi:acyltransferase [Tepidibacter mesophilus]|uniref:acyltransferase n=1 Tax=Tepidibacter mesophilus TaxID=655607 RepID=UPI000C078978|nr:acyltransferase [Tepidibacter mesophilus]
MKRYIRAGICLIYSLIKFSLIKLFHMKNFRFTVLNLISPFTEIEIGKRAKLLLGKMVRARSGVKIKVRNGAEVQIGDNTSLNHGCMIISHENIIIGKNVQFGPGVLIYDHDHDFRAKNGLKELKYKTSPVEIGDNVWIGANTVILRGTRIGHNCVVGAGSVINGEFADHMVILQKRKTIEQRIDGDRL